MTESQLLAIAIALGLSEDQLEQMVAETSQSLDASAAGSGGLGGLLK